MWTEAARKKAHEARRKQARPLESRFWHRLKKVGECWEWQGAQDTHGYGLIRLSRKEGIKRTHIVAWWLKHGRLPPEGMCVCHTCDNPLCCRPSHLWIGTPGDNSRDRQAKGRTRGIIPGGGRCSY